ncbi:hypothetical protein LIT25_16230 [Bacillus sp. F19]|nr:hypothetical protein LIT25_16230 [Bacillus sp. F19]
MFKRIIVLYFFSISVLAGCSDFSNIKSSEKSASIKESEKSESLNGEEKIKLNDFEKINYSPIDLSEASEFKLPDFELENAECMIFGPIDLKKSEKITLTFQLQSNDSINHMGVGIIKDFIPDTESNYEIEKINSKSIDNELKVTYTSPVDSQFSISILGTMADNVDVKNGKIIKH